MKGREVFFDSLLFRGDYPNEIAFLPNEEKPFTGDAVILAENGQKESERKYKEGKLDGTPAFVWYEEGQRSFEQDYEDGEPGEWRTFPSAGDLPPIKNP